MCEECGEHHEAIQAAIEGLGVDQAAVRRELQEHIAKTHAHIADVSQVQEWDREILEKVDQLGTAIHGPIVDGFDGPHRSTAGGMVTKLDTVESIAFENRASLEEILSGGIRARLAVSDKVLVALVAAVATVGVAILGG